MALKESDIVYHPASEIFPLLEGEEFDALVEDIKRNGLLEPIVMYEDKVLDGRNRWRACLATDVMPKFVDWDGKGSPIEYVVSANLRRRHLTAGQRASFANKFKKVLAAEAKERQREGQKAGGKKAGRGRKSSSPKLDQSNSVKGQSATKAAKMAGVSRSAVYAAQKVEKADPEVFAKLEQGKISISEATALVAQPTEKQPEVIVRPVPDPVVDELLDLFRKLNPQQRAEFLARVKEATE